ncbi:tetratricopeptide repeat protein [Variovorax sp. GB1P17]|uniref:tetratricopeptide repeat protein n=1 Tax=Variovorax sp. GB1P17 TaxID=3443740 RepID=UPI003F44D0FD
MNTPTNSSSVPGLSPEALERMLASGRDGALLRMSLALAYHRREETQTALMHVEKALAFDPEFTAAGRLHGLIALALGDNAKAEAAFAKALEVAQRRGEMQLVKELTVRLRRLSSPR